MREPEEVLNAIGIEVRDLSLRERLRGFRGVVVTRVLRRSLGEGKVQPGDLLVAVNREPLASAGDFYRHVSAAAAVQATTLHMIRGSEASEVQLPALPRDSER